MATGPSAFEEKLREYKRTQSKLQECLNSRVSLMGQMQENQVVEKELSGLADDCVIYKLVGPVLVRHTLVEAKANVEKRMEYIKGELKRADDLAASLQTRLKEMAEELEKLKIKSSGATQGGVVQAH
eukprot:Trichotokara_eunicae@DN5520_c0_g1_i1.p1